MKYMKSIFMIMASIALGVMLAGCDKNSDVPVVDNGGTDIENNEDTKPVPTAVLTVDVTGIEESHATFSAEITSGEASAFKVVYNYPVADLVISPENAEALIRFVESAGVEVAELPHQRTLVNLPHNVEYISAVICYYEGEVIGSSYKTWTSIGAVWGDETGAGNLPLNPWN